jgi:hypothetical protein
MKCHDIFQALRIFLPYKPIKRQCDVLLVCNDADRNLLSRGVWYAPILDTIQSDLLRRKISCLGIARILSQIRGVRAYGLVYAQDGPFLRGATEKILRQKLLRRYRYSTIEERCWGRILDETMPKFVIGILPSRELCCAAHRRNIPVADLQHGVINQAAKRTLKNQTGCSDDYYSLAIRRYEPKTWVPDYALCWDRCTAKGFESWAFAALKTVPVVIGNPWFDRFRHAEKEDSLVQNLISDSSVSNQAAYSPKPLILVTLQWGRSEIPNGIISDELIECIKETSDKYNWHIRLHPNQIKGMAAEEMPAFLRIFKEQLASHSNWKWATYSPLPAVLSRTRLHVTWYSSTVIDAAVYGIPSCLLNQELRPGGKLEGAFSGIIESGLACIVANDKLALNDWIHARTTNGDCLTDFARTTRKTYSEFINHVCQVVKNDSIESV